MSASDAVAQMNALYRAPEAEVLAGLLPSATLSAAERDHAMQQARLILKDLKTAQSTGWVNRFL